jgi:hypothetical protein
MSSERLTGAPLEPEILGLIERERSDPFLAGGGLDAGGRRAAMVKRLEHAAMGMAAVGAGSLTGAAAEAARTALASGLEGQAKRLVSWSLLAKIGVASLLFAAGGVTGAWFAAHRGGPAPLSLKSNPLNSNQLGTVPSESQPVPPLQREEATPPATPTVSFDSLPRAASSLGGHAAVQPQPSTSAPPPATSLAEEQRLLDTARAAVARQAYSAALSTLGEHASRFPRGRLAEERELLFVQALAGSGSSVEASERAKAFERQYPGSIFLPAVKAASSSKDP